MKRPEIESVWQYIDDHREEYLELLKKFCRQPSVSAQGLGIREMAELVRETVSGLGGGGRLYETAGNPIVFGELDYGRERTLMLYNHYDVVPPEPYEQWETPPFEPTVVGDRIVARGAADNKGSLLSRYCAVDAYQKVHGTLPINVKFMAEGEEEIGSVHLGGGQQGYQPRPAPGGPGGKGRDLLRAALPLHPGGHALHERGHRTQRGLAAGVGAGYHEKRAKRDHHRQLLRRYPRDHGGGAGVSAGLCLQ